MANSGSHAIDDGSYGRKHRCLAWNESLASQDIIRVDYIVTAGEKINLLEVNTTPGMTATSFIPQQVRAAGLEIKDVMTDIIENKF